MLCCGGKSPSRDYSNTGSPRFLEKRKSTDVCCLFFFLFFTAFVLIYSTIAYIYGNPIRLIQGVDSFGNICGRYNSFIQDLPHSGKDLHAKRYLFYLNIANVTNSLKLCVERCPDRDINTPQDLITFYRETNISLCRYDVDFSYYITASPADLIRKSSDKGLGPCPKFPVFKS